MSMVSSGKFRLGRGLLGLLTVIMVTSLVPSMVMAQEEEPMSQIDALQLIRTANDAFEAGNFEEAYGMYQRAYEILPEPTIRYRMGQTAKELGLNREAVEHFEAYEQEGDDPERLAYINETVPTLRAGIPGVVAVETTPEGGQVLMRVEGEEVELGRAPGEFEVPAGEHTLIVRLQGYQEERWSGVIEPDGREGWEVRLSEVLPEAQVMEESEAGVSPVQIAGWSSLGVGIVGLAVGGYFSMQQSSATQLVNEYDKRDESASRGELESLKEEATGYYQTARIAYISGGVLTAVGAGLAIFDRLGDDGQEQVVRLDAGFSRQGGYVGLRGRF